MGFFDWASATFDEITSGAHVEPDPTVSSAPPPPMEPRTWTAPDVSSGNLEVSNDALYDASNVIKRSLPDIDNAVSQINTHAAAFDSLMSWSTGQAFGSNLATAVQGFSTVGQQHGDAHNTAAQNLSLTADTYDETETNNTQALKNISGQLPSGGWT